MPTELKYNLKTVPLKNVSNSRKSLQQYARQLQWY